MTKGRFVLSTVYLHSLDHILSVCSRHCSWETIIKLVIKLFHHRPENFFHCPPSCLLLFKGELLLFVYLECIRLEVRGQVFRRSRERICPPYIHQPIRSQLWTPLFTRSVGHRKPMISRSILEIRRVPRVETL